MDHIKSVLAIFLMLCILLSLCACGSKDEPAYDGDVHYKEYLYNEDKVSGMGAMQEVKTPLDPVELYASVTYTPAMFCGMYSYGNQFEYGVSLEEQEERRAEFLSQVSLVPYTGEYSESRTALPIGYRAGYNTLYSVYSTINGRYWMEMTFLNENQNIMLVKGSYTVSGNTLYFYPFAEYDYDNETETLHYTLEETPMEFGFSFSGPELTLSADGETAVLTAHGFESGSVVTTEAYAAPDSPLLGGITNIFYYATDEKGKEYKNLRLEVEDGEDGYTVSDAILRLEECGLATLTWSDEYGEHVYQAIYFHAGKDGIVLYDGTETYYYTDDYTLHTRGRVSCNVAEDVDLEVLTDTQVEDLSKKRSSLLKALSEAFAATSLAVTVDAATGEVMLDSAVLFAVNSSEISPEGQQFLQEFIRIYTEVLSREEYDGFVSAVVVEGHTDTNGSYESNQILSEERANSVMDFCLSDACGLSDHELAALSAIISAKGYSYDFPVIAMDGSIDMAASRRVSFSFLIHVDTEG